jgi:hypothetical protein
MRVTEKTGRKHFQLPLIVCSHKKFTFLQNSYSFCHGLINNKTNHNTLLINLLTIISIRKKVVRFCYYKKIICESKK